MRQSKFAVILLLISLVSSWAQDNPLEESPGAIPMTIGQDAAKNLWFQNYSGNPLTTNCERISNGNISLPEAGSEISVSVADCLRSEDKIDISLLNPNVTNSLIWSNKYHKGTIPKVTIDFDGTKEYRFTSVAQSSYGYFRFLIENTDNAELAKYKIIAGKDIHTLSLRRALMIKLGYKVPQFKRIPKLTLKFVLNADLKNFIQLLQGYTLGDVDDWIVSEWRNDETTTLVLQDLLVSIPTEDRVYNYAENIIQKLELKSGEILKINDEEREINSLLVAHELVHFPESINLKSYTFGDEISQQLGMKLPGAEQYFPKHEDAKWMARRIAVLTEEDFKEIVDYSDLPAEEAALLLERIKYTRNNMVEKFNIYEDVKQFKRSDWKEKFPFVSEQNRNEIISIKKKLSANISITVGDGSIVKNGKLLLQKREGYATKFAFGDPDSPFSKQEFVAFLKSKVYSNLILNAVSRFNDEVLPNVDLQKEVLKKQIKFANEQLKEFFETGVRKEIPFGFYPIRMGAFQGHISRDIVIGSYLGTDNKIQLADSIGFLVRGGVHIGTKGLKSGSFAAISPSINKGITYTHIKPTTSIKESLKESWSNLFIKRMRKKYGNKLNQAIDYGLTRNADDITTDEAIKAERKRLSEILADFKDGLLVGESFIITTSTGGSLSIQGGHQFDDWVSATAAIGGQVRILSRMHITRASKDYMHIYIDKGNAKGLSAAFKLGAKIQVLGLNYRTNMGEAESHLYKLNIDANVQANDKLFTNLQILKEFLAENETEILKKHYYPNRVKIDYNDKKGEFSLFHKHFGKLKQKVDVDIFVPKSMFKTVRDDEEITVAENTNTHIIGAGQYSSRRKRSPKSGKSRITFKRDKENNVSTFRLPHEEEPISLYRQGLNQMKGKNYEKLVLDIINAGIDELDEDNDITISNTSNGRPSDSFMGSSFIKRVIYDAEESYIEPGQYDDEYVTITNQWQGWALSREKAEDVIDIIHAKAGEDIFDASTLHNVSKIRFYSIVMNYEFSKQGLDYLLNLKNEEVAYIFTNFSLDTAKKKALNKFLKLRNKYFEKIVGNQQKAINYLLKAIRVAETALKGKTGMLALVGGEKNIIIRAVVMGFKEGREDSLKGPYPSKTIGAFASDDDDFRGPFDKQFSSIGFNFNEFFAFIERL